MIRPAAWFVFMMTLSVLVTGCDWYGQDEVALRPLPYPYAAGVATESDGEPLCLVSRGVTFAFGGEEVRTAGQDAACSLVDRGRQLWESLAFLYSGREWRASSFFGNRLFEPRTSGGVATYEYKVYVGPITRLQDRMPADVATQIAEALVYELRVKGGVMIVARPAADRTGPFASVTEYLELEHERGRLYRVGRDRLLAYSFVRRFLDWSTVRTDDGVTIRVRAVDDGLTEPWVPTLEELSGITFYTPDPERTRVFLGGELLRGVTVNPPDWTHRGSVTIGPPALSPTSIGTST